MYTRLRLVQAILILYITRKNDNHTVACISINLKKGYNFLSEISLHDMAFLGAYTLAIRKIGTVLLGKLALVLGDCCGMLSCVRG